MPDVNDQIKALQAQIKQLEQKIEPTASYPSEKEIAAHKNEIHQLAEARMSRAAYFSPEDLRAMRAAAPDNVCRDLATDARAPLGPRSIIPSKPISNVSEPAVARGSGTGWAPDVPVRPPPGINYVDAQLDAQDRRDRAERIQREEAIRRAGRK